MKFRFIFIFVLIFFVFTGFTFGDEIVSETSEALSEVYEGEPVNIVSLICPDSDLSEIIVDEVTVDVGEGVSTLTFNSIDFNRRNGRVKIGNNDFSNIASQPDRESYLKVDSFGEIVEMDIRIASDVQEIKFSEDNIISAKPGDRVILKDGEVKIIVSSDSSGKVLDISKWSGSEGDLVLEGNNFEYWKDEKRNIFDYGEIVHFDGENFYFLEGEVANHKGIEISPKGKVFLFNDGKSHEGDYISFGKGNFVVGIGEDPNIFGKIFVPVESEYYQLRNVQGVNLKDINIDREEYFSSRVRPGKSFSIELVEPNSNVNFFGEVNPIEPGVPMITPSSSYVFESGKVFLENKEGKLKYFRNSGEYYDALDVVIDDKANQNYDKMIQIGENSNVIVYFKDKLSGWNYDPLSESGNREVVLAMNHGEEGNVLYRALGTEKLQEEFVRVKSELLESSNLLREELRKRCGDNIYDKYFSQEGTLYSYEVPQEALDCSLNKEIMKKVLGGNYENFNSNLKTVSDMSFDKDVLGNNEEGSSALDLQYYGFRTNRAIRDLTDYGGLWNKYAKWVLERYPQYSRGSGKLAIVGE
jgi:hypothetical protein